MKTKVLIILLLSSFNLYSQDFYDHTNSYKFGEYLYNSNQFGLAVREFERCVFLKPNDRESFLYLFKIYRKTNAFDQAIASYQHYSGNLYFDQMDIDFGTEYFKLLVENRKYGDAFSFLKSNTSFNDKSDFKFATILLNKNWVEAESFKNIKQVNNSLAAIARQGNALKKKSPVVAGLISAIIPGSGKVYAGRWKDGIISFIMTTTTAFIAYRGYNKNPQNFYPWGMGTLAVIYYSGNIYGSTQAVLKYNKDKEDELVNKTRAYILSDH